MGERAKRCWVCKLAAAFGAKEDFFLVSAVGDKVVLVLGGQTALGNQLSMGKD